MKRFSVVFAFVLVILLGTSVLAQSISATNVTGNTANFVKNIASNRGIPPSDIKDVKQVDLNNLPSEVNIKNIDNTSIAMYQVNLNNSTKPIYVITASQNEFKKAVQNFTSRMLLNLGLSGTVDHSEFLMSAAGVQGSTNQGYVMLRSGSITGLSTSLNVEKTLAGKTAQIVIYKNGQLVGFRNTFDLGKTGPQSDYNTLGEGIINFNKGDVISIEVLLPEGAQVKDINTLLELTNKE